jgi:predicted RNase H-like nuclease
VDGCRAGWVVATSDLVVRDGGTPALSAPRFSIERSFRTLLDGLQGQGALIGIDIPIGLPSGAPYDGGRRRADAEARMFLGPRRVASVFSAPCRPTLAARGYREACDLEVQARGGGKGISQQAYNIIPKIRDVDDIISPAHQGPLDASVRAWVREVHPEVTFAVLAGDGHPGRGLIHSKRGCKTCRGQDCPGERERLALLRPYVPDFGPRSVHAQLVRDYPRAAGSTGTIVARDDIVDAVACLVTALRIVSGCTMTFPSAGPEVDARGLRMEIVA